MFRVQALIRQGADLEHLPLFMKPIMKSMETGECQETERKMCQHTDETEKTETVLRLSHPYHQNDYFSYEILCRQIEKKICLFLFMGGCSRLHQKSFSRERKEQAAEGTSAQDPAMQEEDRWYLQMESLLDRILTELSIS